MIDALLGLPGKINTLLSRLTSTRAGLMDNLDAAMSTRAAASTALSNANWTNALAAALANIAQKGPLAIPKASGIESGSSGTVLSYANLWGVVTVSQFLPTLQGTNCKTATTTSTSYQDAINYTGSGFLDFCMGVGSDGWLCDFEIIIDGVTAFSGDTLSTRGARVAVGSGGWVPRLNAASNWDNWFHVSPQPIPFNTSLQIRYKRGTGTGVDTTVGMVYRVVKTS